MFLEIRKKGSKKKFYLVHSYREGNKVKKIARYLGVDLTKKQLERLKPRAKKLILEQLDAQKSMTNPLYTVLSKDEISEIKNLEKSIPLKVAHLDKKDWRVFTKIFAYDTNAIEGSTVTQKEVDSILEKNEWPTDKAKWEIAETYGVADAINHIKQIKVHITLEMIKKLHKIVFRNSKEFAGNFRKKGVEVAVMDKQRNIVHRGAPSTKIIKLLKELIKWYNKNKSAYSGLVLAAVVHNQFETIHPFEDGNGRVGRLLLNNILIKHNLPPVNIRFNDRQVYYKALREYQDDGNIRPMIDLILKEYKR